MGYAAPDAVHLARAIAVLREAHAPGIDELTARPILARFLLHVAAADLDLDEARARLDGVARHDTAPA